MQEISFYTGTDQHIVHSLSLCLCISLYFSVFLLSHFLLSIFVCLCISRYLFLSNFLFPLFSLFLHLSVSISRSFFLSNALSLSLVSVFFTPCLLHYPSVCLSLSCSLYLFPLLSPYPTLSISSFFL